MKDKPSKKVRDALKALQRAVAKALADHRRLGHPIYIWEHGKVVRVRAAAVSARRPHHRKAA